jgi:hypothetical protein
MHLRRLAVLACLAVLVSAAAGCAGSRPAVIANGSEVADLWWSGELTDQKGNRWDIAILPGMGPSFELASESYSRSGRRFAEYGNPKYWHAIGNMSKNCFVFAGADCLRDFIVTGIGDDYSDTTGTLCRLASERPFGWIAHTAWRVLWGYGIKPIGRVALGPVGAIGSSAAGLVVPVGGALYPPVAGVADVAVMGIAVPAARIVWQQPAWMFSLINNEPDEATNGSWGLSIIARPPGWKPPQGQLSEEPLLVDEARIRRLAHALVELEERLIRSNDQEHEALLRVHDLQHWDGKPAEFTVEPKAKAWLDKTAAAELENWRTEAGRRLGTSANRLPSADEMLKLLHQAMSKAMGEAPGVPAPDQTPMPSPGAP